MSSSASQGTYAARLATAALLLPAVALVVLLLGLPFIVLAANAITAGPPGTITFWPWTLENLEEIFTDWYYIEILGRTLVVSATVTLICAVLAYPLSIGILLTQSRALRFVYIVAALTPLLTSVVIRAFGWQVFFGPGGPVANVLVSLLGPQHLRGILNTRFSLIAGLTHLGLPFMMLMLLPILVRIDRSMLRASAVLGATPLQTFRRVLLPLSLPGLIAGCAVTFSVCSTVVATPVVLGGRQQMVFSMLIFEEVLKHFNWNLGGALAVVLMVAVVLVAGIFTVVGQRRYAAWMLGPDSAGDR